MREHSYAVYLITNTRRGVLYVGVTSNLASRITHHREGATVGFTRRYGCRYLVWFEIHTDIHALALYFAFYNF